MSFASTFAGTLEYATKVLDDNFEGPRKGRPALFAPSESPFPTSTPLSELPPDTPQKVTLKSIRAPKFSVEYTVPLSDSVYSLKERLLTDPAGPLGDSAADHTPASIKLLIKSKVVADTKQLAELSSFQFIVMFVNDIPEELRVPLPAQIYWGEEAAIINAQNTSQSEPAAAAGSSVAGSKQLRQLPGLTDDFWHEIENVAKRYVADPKSLVETFKISTATDSMDLD